MIALYRKGCEAPLRLCFLSIFIQKKSENAVSQFYVMAIDSDVLKLCFQIELHCEQSYKECKSFASIHCVRVNLGLFSEMTTVNQIFSFRRLSIWWEGTTLSGGCFSAQFHVRQIVFSWYKSYACGIWKCQSTSEHRVSFLRLSSYAV